MPGFGVGFNIDMRTLSESLRNTDKAFAASLKRELRKAVQEEGAALVQGIKARASWSTGNTSSTKYPHSSIAAATSIAITLGTKSANVRIRVNNSKAPHARPWEMGSGRSASGVLRHPVFGRKAAGGAEASPIVRSKRQSARQNVDRSKWTWTTTTTRPFFFSTIGQRDPITTKRFEEVMNKVVTDAIKGRE